VAACSPFLKSQQANFEAFSEVDEIRLIGQQMNSWLKMEELEAQGIIVTSYPAATFASVMELQTKWASMSKVFSVPDYNNDDCIRGYFGEKIAFFFQWTTFFVRGLSWLAFFGIMGYLHLIPGMPVAISQNARSAFFVVVAVWSALFNQLFKNRMNRNRQFWGVESFEGSSIVRTDYDPNLEWTWKLTLRKSAVQIGCFLYLVGFVQILALIAQHRKSAKENDTTDYSAIMVTLVIKVGGWCYARTAHIWVGLQNHRTQNEFENALAINLVLVKLFIALFPFLEFAFLNTYSDPTCAASLAAAAEIVYKGKMPPGTNATDMSWLDTSTFVYQSGDKTCIYGCYPALCEVIQGVTVCQTNCVADLESTLIVTFVTMVVATIGLMIAPIFLIRFEIFKEMRACAEDPNSTYSWLQIQAKQHELAPYEYYSWGGSWCEDFLEYVICFTILVCFGMMLPVIAIIGFVTSMITYRLFAFRITNVTCRPTPESLDGI
jgi:hypothetical protein